MQTKLHKPLSVLLALLMMAGVIAALPVTAGADFTTTPMISAGIDHSLALKRDGTVWAWGNNSCGQLGDGTRAHRYSPVQAAGLTGVTAVAAGDGFSLALKSDGTVWSWGAEGGGVLGYEHHTFMLTPTQVPGLTGVTAIAAGYVHCLALKSDGTVWAWGINEDGELGDGSTTQRTSPGQVPGLSGVTAVAAGGAHSLARKSDGTLWSWGWNIDGQLGDGTDATKTSPVQVPGLSGVTAIAAGAAHSLAGKGAVWAWGNNDGCQLGDGNLGEHRVLSPVAVTGGLSGVTALAAGGVHSLALKSDGTVWAWGTNFLGQLGVGSAITYFCPSPMQIPSLSGVTAIAAGVTHSLALKSDGTVWAWGDNPDGELGDGSTTQRSVPVQVKGAGGAGWLNLLAATPTAAPGITGPAALTLTAGYAAQSTGAYTITGSPAPAVTKQSGDAKITWNNATKKLDIAAGLAAGTYPVTLKAANGVSPDASFTFTLKVNAAGGGGKTIFNTGRAATFLNWILFIVFFGWLWM